MCAELPQPGLEFNRQADIAERRACLRRQVREECCFGDRQQFPTWLGNRDLAYWNALVKHQLGPIERAGNGFGGPGYGPVCIAGHVHNYARTESTDTTGSRFRHSRQHFIDRQRQSHSL